MNDQYVKNVIEAAMLAAGRPLTMDELVSVFDERDGSNAEEVRGAIAALTADYETRGLELLEVASGYRIQIRAGVAEPVSRLWQERPAKYSRALLETLALVAYRQPITRGEIEQIRGVAVNPNIIKTLLERSWIRVVGHRDVPGKPELREGLSGEGAGIQAGTFAEAAQHGELLVLAVLGDAAEGAIADAGAGNFSGKVVLIVLLSTSASTVASCRTPST